MASEHAQTATLASHSPGQIAWRQLRVRARQAVRLVRWRLEGDRFPRPETGPRTSDDHLIYRHAVPIARSDADAHPLFEAGKRHNVRLAARAFDGLVLEPNQPLSFWRTLGRISEADGYRYGMELRGGCVVPAVGGGVCLLSNALFEVAVALGWTIVERHGHSLEAIPPAADAAVWGLDATVFWPHVDLRVAPTAATRLAVFVERDGATDLLIIEAYGERSAPSVELEMVDERVVRDSAGAHYRLNRVTRRVGGQREVIAENRRRILGPVGRRRSCLTCDETDCHARPARLTRLGAVR